MRTLSFAAREFTSSEVKRRELLYGHISVALRAGEPLAARHPNRSAAQVVLIYSIG